MFLKIQLLWTILNLNFKNLNSLLETRLFNQNFLRPLLSIIKLQLVLIFLLFKLIKKFFLELFDIFFQGENFFCYIYFSEI